MALDGTERISYGREAVIYMSGAFANLLSLLIPFMGEPFYVCSVGAAIFNLIPFAGSDGQRLLYTLTSLFISPSVAQKLTNSVSRVFTVALWLFAVTVNLHGEGSFALLLLVTYVLLSYFKVKK